MVPLLRASREKQFDLVNRSAESGSTAQKRLIEPVAAALGGRPPAQIMRVTQRKLTTGSSVIEKIDRGADTRDRGNEIAEHIVFDRNPEARQTILKRLIAALSALKKGSIDRQ